MLPAVAEAQVVPAIRTPVAPSQVTPRSLLPAVPVVPTPLDLPESAPAQAPKGSDDVHVTIAHIAIDGGFVELAEPSARIVAPLEGKIVSVGDLYRAAAALEKTYADAGFFLARVVVVRQRIADGGVFHLVVIDGFIETVDVQALPWRARRPVRLNLQSMVGRRHLKLDEMERRLNAAGAVPGVTLRSTIGRGDRPGGARLILDGRFTPFSLSIDGDNRLGPSFRDWGLSLQGQINSPTGHGEQVYMFFSGAPRLDHAFRSDALRRVGGLGVLIPLGGGGVVLNPEFTISDTHPLAANPILATAGRLYRGSLNLSAPLVTTKLGTLSGKVTADIVSETQTLPFFGLTFYRDRLVVARANLSWDGAITRRTTFSALATLSHGLDVPGARSAGSIADSNAPTSRGSNPQFSRIELRFGIDQQLIGGFALALVGRMQNSFGTVVPNSETFDLTGLDSLSSFTAGALIADGGESVRAELSRPVRAALAGLQMSLTPYAYAAAGRLHYVFDDPLSPTRATSYGIGVRINGADFPFGAKPHVTLEYGHGHDNRGFSPDDRLSVALGVQF